MKTSKGCIICDPTRDQYLMNTAGFFPPFFFWKSPLQCFLSTCQTYNCFPTSFEMKAQSLLKKMMYLETAWVHVSAPKKTQSIILLSGLQVRGFSTEMTQREYYLHAVRKFSKYHHTTFRWDNRWVKTYNKNVWEKVYLSDQKPLSWPHLYVLVRDLECSRCANVN